MELKQAIQGRRSIRAFETRKSVQKEVMTAILESAILAPTGGNAQPWHFFVLEQPEIKLKLVRAALKQKFIAQGTFVVVVCIDEQQAYSTYRDRGVGLYSIQDTAAAIQNMLLTAYSFGLGSCWVGAFSEEQVSFCLELPHNLRPVAIIPFGYPAEAPSRPQRKPLSTVCTWI
ncbi:nitroreductase family protein [candidate division CSSED10-310 bacterium]|uniref:Nitroreductase family protein n=1 Tax=candidate division CSSED10-310 bacterium TaxID=2855610 RepID=A0ABV6YW67_UNCC1